MAGSVKRKVPASIIHVPIGMFQDAAIRLGVQNRTTCCVYCAIVKTNMWEISYKNPRNSYLSLYVNHVCNHILDC